MYLILDLHGAPGGQGKDANISDYDETKPSLWESGENISKTIALWRKLAERYSNEPWMGGYDLINETNWSFKESGKAPLVELLRQLTKAIREVDSHHIIILEGNGWGNDYKGLTPPWDGNMVYSFHKYWSYNTPKVIKFITTLRDTCNVPIWLGESGENSNTWFTNCIALCDDAYGGMVARKNRAQSKVK
jgi:aryl-phospho-beta-D-glucosidase BglC (GH1 family)